MIHDRLEVILMYVQKIILIVSIGVMLLPMYALGATGINAEIPFYGTLRDAGGAVVTGTYSIVFKIYDAPVGGTVLWDETQSVEVTRGIFNVMLGSNSPLTALNFNDDSYYLGITIGTDTEMTPRERLGATPYAFNSKYLGGFDASAFIQMNQVNDILNRSLTVSTSTTSALVTLNQTGAGNILALGNGVDELFTVLQTGNVGIGDLNPTEKLVVEGTVSALTFLSTDSDGVNSFAGPLEVTSGENSSFGGDLLVSGNVIVAEGSRLYLGSEGSGLSFYQDTGIFDGNSLVMMPYGEALTGDAKVKLLAPSALELYANTGEDGSGMFEPALTLNDDGSARIYNLLQGNATDRIFRIDFTSGVEVVTGDLDVLNGNVSIAGVDALNPSLIVDGDGGLRVSNLADAIDITFDSAGNFIPNYSDEKLKENIRTIDDALDIVRNLRGVRYEWKDTTRFASSTQIGFVAQELQEELPELVRESGGYLSVNTKNLTAVIVEAIKELYDDVQRYFSRTEALEREVRMLREELNALKDELDVDVNVSVEEILQSTTETESTLVDPLPTTDTQTAEGLESIEETIETVLPDTAHDE